jgi:glutamyl-tRNA reductase
VIGPWALIVSAGGASATARATAAREMEDWLAHGGRGVALVTCHRAELYGVGSMPHLGPAATLAGGSAVAHLLRVACGLESVIVGEDEVLHQVRGALTQARSTEKLEPRLQRLFETAIAAGRKARSRRTASSGNLAQSAVAWLRLRASVAGRTVVVAGAGRMGAALAHSLDEVGADLIIASRDPRRAARLARVYAGRGVGLEEGADLSGGAAGVAVALGGPWIELARAKSETLPPIADISAPQAVPDAVRRRLDGSFLGIDDLYSPSRPLPGAYIEDARRLVELKTAEYMAYLGQSR